MCNDYERHIRWAEYCQMMRDLSLGIPTRQSELDLPPSDDVRINETAPRRGLAGGPDCARGARMSFGFRTPEGFFGLFWLARIVHPFGHERSPCR